MNDSRKFITLALLMTFGNSFAVPMTEGVEYKCNTVKVIRFQDKNSNGQEMKMPQSKSFYISIKNNTLNASYKDGSGSEPAINNATFVSKQMANENGRKFDAMKLNKKTKDGSIDIDVIKEISPDNKSIALKSVSSWNSMSAFIVYIDNCIN